LSNIVKKNKVPKPFASGTMTNTAFFSMIRSALRQKSRWWKPITDCKMSARRKYKGLNKRLKWEYQCNNCKNYFPDKKIQVDHITPAGSLNSFEDLPSFVKNLFCEKEGLQVLCSTCHDIKTKKEIKLRKTKKDELKTNNRNTKQGVRKKSSNRRKKD